VFFFFLFKNKSMIFSLISSFNTWFIGDWTLWFLVVFFLWLLLLLVFWPHVCWKIDKSRWKKYFFETLFELFSALYILPICCQNRQVFLDWSEVFIMPNSFLFYLVFKVE
jgi:hypothetical protein